MSEENSLLHQLYLARNWARSQREYEISTVSINERPWADYESGIQQYDERFDSLDLRNRFSFKEVIRNWKSKGLVLEAFGEGTLIRKLVQEEKHQGSTRGNIAGGVAVTLSDIRSPEQVKFDKENNVRLIAGDFYLGSTYRHILEDLQRSRYTGFKCIVCYPLAGWDIGEDQLDPPIDLVWIILRRLYSLLEDGGELFIDLPHQVMLKNEKIDLYKIDFFWDRWIAECKERNIVIQRGYGGTLRIVGNGEQKLPRFPTELLL